MNFSHKTFKIVSLLVAGVCILILVNEFRAEIYKALKFVLPFLIVLGIIVLVHEFGHYIAARLTGVRVEVFSFGFGKRLLGKKFGETDLRLSLIPLGGYVKMAGEEEYDPKNLKPYEFHAKNRGQKIFILVMGPFMNLLLAFIIFTIVNISGVEIEKYKQEPPRIGYVIEDSPGYKAGIRPGDLILAIEDRKINSWKDLDLFIGANPNQVLPVVYERDGKRFKTSIKVNLATRYNVGDAGLYWDFRTTIGEVKKDFPAFEAGIKEGDIILSVDGQPLNYFKFADVIAENAEKALSFEVKRGEKIRNLEITPRKIHFLESEALSSEEEASHHLQAIKKRFPELTFDIIPKAGTYKVISDYIESEAKASEYENILNLKLKEKVVIGIEKWAPYSPTIKIRYGVVDAVLKSKNDIVYMTGFVIRFLKKLIMGKVSTGQISGPLDIADYSKKAMEMGLSHYFMLIAFISLQLGLINLVPIPALDGGHLMIYSIEAIIRREFSLKVKTILMNIGFLILICLMAFVILNDIAKKLPNGWDTIWPF
jgi:regulator of sigma E protease